ncbi:MAG: response regulator transcription factor [Tissierellia bacterium]|nr:response regulator transcription factor [Tissierellia bacterium]
MNKTILIVEDDNINLKILNSILGKYDYSTLMAKTGQEAIDLLNNNKVIGAILDINLPDMSGLEILKYIRNHPIHKNIAVLIVTVNQDKLDTILGLEMGADDYITKPFHHRELIARLNAAIRRSREVEVLSGPLITIHDLVIDVDKRLVMKNGEIISLSFKEFEILYLLASNPGKVIQRETILNKIGDINYAPNTRVVDMHISSIRKKLGERGKGNSYIDTISGVGYRFRE